ncbi:hypothetical protein [Kribbella kalugense]|uniref:Uncharacterized protein n=1 Tax=Kribbella kalugense TaxID=2512221 RepID=A0A4R7ZDL3_9ACTN|nr:hypothetical protein [Kribbella kalugense]TDW14996.1 hypothetical protein EV650_6476 [Kribbella kalugense]
MTDLHDSLPDLMRRATEDLEPATPELVARGISRGKVLRRRRTALASLSGAAAVLATVCIIVGSTQFLQHGAAPTVAPAGPPTSRPAKKHPVTPAESLATLAQLLPSGLRATEPTSSGGNGSNMNDATIRLDDGKGSSLLTLSVSTGDPITDCNPFPPGSCTVQPNRSVYVVRDNKPLYTDQPNPGGLRQTAVELFHPDGTQISLTSYNAPKDKGVEHSRPRPLLTVAQLTQIAYSKQWAYPPRAS